MIIFSHRHHKRESARRFNGGFTLVEIMIALAILSIGVLFYIGSFANTSRAILSSRTRIVAENLAQEKIESMKNISYYRLIPTTVTVTASEPDVGGFLYDTGYYPEEDLSVAGVSFTRRVYVEYVTLNTGVSTPVSMSYLSDDTGLKRIKTFVLWREGGYWKTVQLENLRNNPSYSQKRGTFQGTVRTTNTVAIADAVVAVQQNSSWFTQTNAAGAYSFTAEPGTYTLRAEAYGYFPATQSNVYLSAAGTYNSFNPLLSKMSSGPISGIAYVRDHLVVSQVVGSLDNGGFKQEWVEIYNPTTWTWTIPGNVGLKFQRRAIHDPSPINIEIGTYLRPTIPSRGFYVFANTDTIRIGASMHSADAVWESSIAGANDTNFYYFDPSVSPPELNVIPTHEDDSQEGSGTVTLYEIGSGNTLDKFGWRGGGASQQPPEYEGAAYFHGQTQGLNDDEQYYRYSSASSYNHPTDGPSYDSEDNDNDWGLKTVDVVPIYYPRYSLSALPNLVSGTPASGAYVSANDGLSGPVQCGTTGAFTITRVATGTWTVAFSTETTRGNWYLALSTPMAGSAVDLGVVGITSTTTDGFLMGTVKDAGNNTSISGIQVTGVGATPAVTDSNGRYQLTGGSGPVTIVANPGNLNGSYVSDAVLSTINLGQYTTGVDFYLTRGGRITGQVKIGSAVFPGVPVTASTSSLPAGEAVTGSDGVFTLTNLSTGVAYLIEPQLEAGETYSPTAPTVTIPSAGSSVFSATFTVSNAFGYVTGSVAYGGSAVQTGVLIVLTTTTISAGPPDINSTVRSGNTKYYAASSYSDGTYTVSVPGGSPGTPITYNVYGWYTTLSGGTPSTSKKTTTAAVTGGQTTSGVNFSWP